MGTTATCNINIRVSKHTRALIDKAAEVLGRNRSEFVLDVVQERATQVLLDSRTRSPGRSGLPMTLGFALCCVMPWTRTHSRFTYATVSMCRRWSR